MRPRRGGPGLLPLPSAPPGALSPRGRGRSSIPFFFFSFFLFSFFFLFFFTLFSLRAEGQAALGNAGAGGLAGIGRLTRGGISRPAASLSAPQRPGAASHTSTPVNESRGPWDLPPRLRPPISWKDPARGAAPAPPVADYLFTVRLCASAAANRAGPATAEASRKVRRQRSAKNN